MKNLALPRIRAMEPYRPPLDGRAGYPGLLLDFNERTVPVSEPVAAALRQFADNRRQQLYPEYFGLENKIADYAGAESGQVMVTNGTDQALDVIFRTFADKGDKVVIPEPSFAMYGQSARIIGCRVSGPAYTGDIPAFPLREVMEVIDGRTKLIVVCNPNNPTGTLLPVGDIARIATKAKRAIVYVDEAYFEFSGCSAVELIKKYPNVIISRTFSKAFGLAGLRIGYVVADKRYVNEMLKVRGPYDVNQAAAAAAMAALNDIDGTQAYVREVMERAKPMVEEFFADRGIKFYPSAGNFILFRPDNPALVLRALSGAGILMRPQNKPGIEGSLRLTIGTVDQMKAFIKAYESIEPAPPAPKYAFLDRDGTLIHEPPDGQVDSLDKLRVLDGAIDGLKLLLNRGYRLVLVTNQDGLGTPAFPVADFRESQRAMIKTFKAAGIRFEAVLICPHRAVDKCQCRKPGTALVDGFLHGRDFDKRQTFVCGDRPSDRRLAANLGLRFMPMPKNGNFYRAINTLVKGVDNED